MREKIDRAKRILHRGREELDATIKIAKLLSWHEGAETFLAKMDMQVMNHNGCYENDARKKHLLRKHAIMIRYYEKLFGDFLSAYDYRHKNAERKKSDHSSCIWICWWQGLENAPEIVKACVASIREKAGNHPVIVLTDQNYRQYVTMPEWVEEKKKKGILSKTNYSDLLRLSLLAEYGGMWLDATFFCASPSMDSCFQDALWSIKRPDYFHASVACGYFAGYSLACREESRFAFMTIRDFFLYYWKQSNTMVDYLMIDYMIVLAQKYDERIAELFREIQPNNPECDELVKVLNEPFNQEQWETMKKDTALFKLTWKRRFLKEINGKPTFYGYLMEHKL